MGQHLNFTSDGKAVRVKATVRTGFGKSDWPGSQGGLRKREIGRKEEPAVCIERVHVGHSPPNSVRASILSRLSEYVLIPSHMRRLKPAATNWPLINIDNFLSISIP